MLPIKQFVGLHYKDLILLPLCVVYVEWDRVPSVPLLESMLPRAGTVKPQLVLMTLSSV